jgi:hypothetical protein
MFVFLVPFLAVLGLVAAAKYVYVPLVVWRSPPSRRPRVRALGAEEAPDAVRAAVKGIAGTLGTSGFRLIGVCDVNDGTAVVVHAHQRASGIHLLDYLTTFGRWQVFLTHFQDGGEVTTSNAPALSVFSRAPDVHTCTFPPGTDLRTLYDAHVAHLRLRGADAMAVRSPVDTCTFVVEVEERALEMQRSLGMMNREGEAFRPTLRGAFVQTWHLLPPLKGRRAAENVRTVEAVRRLAAGRG